ncbi:MAG: UDP-N-acetylmuramoyl-tripeptide--D-alanyl-D-alanine ligase [Actinomycetota bacterium]
MIRLTTAEIARITGGTLTGDGALVVEGVLSDSRLVGPGDLFAAVRGEFHDGGDFVPAAFDSGAVAALVDQTLTVSGTTIVVEDVLRALASLARYVRDVVDPLVVGITGSVGKTSTKDFLRSIGGRKFSTVATERSLNAEIGVPLTLLNLSPKTELLVCEMGARGVGQIAELCGYVRPQVGIVTNVDVTHLEMFGSREAIARSKGELVEALPEGGTAVLNADDGLVGPMAARTRAEVLTFGLSSEASVRASRVSVDELGRATFRLAYEGEGSWASLPFSGRHQVVNALAAAGAGLALGLSLDECARGLEEASGSPWRMEVSISRGIVIINDAYNAGPRSTASALETAAEMVREGGGLTAVLGHMAELGEIERDEHLRIGRMAAEIAGRVIVVGERAAPIAQGARLSGAAEVIQVQLPDEALGHLEDLGPGDVVLFKGSRIAALELLAERALEMIERVPQ